MNIINNITPMPPIGPIDINTTKSGSVTGTGQPTFLDVFSQIFEDTVNLNGVSNFDKIRMVAGETDDIEMIQLNAQKAGVALELLVNVRNTVLDSYNEIIRMQI